ncbi:hypothetical protein D1007_09833 [Hordeum vulgare]|nr:hypothetical protein D1007_09833 [Hordeum vulgare]
MEATISIEEMGGGREIRAWRGSIWARRCSRAWWWQGGRNLVCMRDNDEGGFSNVDPRHGSSDKARWDADAMEQGGARGSEKWGDSNNTAIAGAAGGKQPQAQDRLHLTPGKRNAAPLVGGAEILVKNPPKEKINVQMEADGGNSPKRTKFNENIRPDGQNISSSTMGESSAPSGMSGGKNMMSVRLDTIQERVDMVQNQEKSEETQSDEESEDVDNVLLIDSMAAEAEKSHMKEIEKQSTVGTSFEKIVVNSMQIVPNPVVHRKFSSYLDACMGEPTVTEMKNDDKNNEKEGQAYFVQSPRGSCEDVDVVPTPPVLEEVQARFSKRTVGINMEHVGARAEKMTKKRNLQGNEPVCENSFDVLSNMEIVNMASHMGVNIPDDDFTIIDVIRELEKSRANIAKKINTDNKQQEEVLLITNAAGESSHLNTAWGDEEDVDEEGFKSVRSRKREKRKVNVVISKPVTRSQNQIMSGIAGLQKPEMAEVMKKGAKMLKANASQMLLLCGPPMPHTSKQDEGDDNWDKW